MPCSGPVISEAESKHLILKAFSSRHSEYFPGKDEEHCPIGRETPKSRFGKLAMLRELG